MHKYYCAGLQKVEGTITNTNAQMQIRKYTNLGFEITHHCAWEDEYKYKCTNANTQIQMHKYKYINAQILDSKYQTTVLPPPGKTPVALPDLRNYKRDIQGKTIDWGEKLNMKDTALTPLRIGKREKRMPC